MATMEVKLSLSHSNDLSAIYGYLGVSHVAMETDNGLVLEWHSLRTNLSE